MIENLLRMYQSSFLKNLEGVGLYGGGSSYDRSQKKSLIHKISLLVNEYNTLLSIDSTSVGFNIDFAKSSRGSQDA
jgi:hypothetical protein